MSDDLQNPFPPEFQEEVFQFLISSRRTLLNFVTTVKPEFFDDPVLTHLWSIMRTHFSLTKSYVPSLGVALEIIRKAIPDDKQKSVDQRETLYAMARRMWESVKTYVPDPYVETRLREFIGFGAVRNIFLEEAENIMTKSSYNPDLPARLKAAIQSAQVDVDVGWFAKKSGVTAIERAADPDVNPPIPTGLHLLDRELGGGLRKGQLGLFMAPPKGSKSTFLLNCAHNAPTVGVRKNVLYLTLELSEELQTLRWAIRTTMLDKSEIVRNPALYTTLYQRRAAAMFSPDHDCVFKFMPPGVCTPNKIRGLLDTIMEEHDMRIDMLVVDYMDLMKSDQKFDTDHWVKEQVQVATDLRQIAVDYDVACWTATKTNRDADMAVSRGDWICKENIGGAHEKLSVVDVGIAGQRYADGLAIVPIVLRNDAGINKIACALNPSKMCIQTTRIIPEGERSNGRSEDEEVERRKGPGGGRKKKDELSGKGFRGGASATGKREMPRV